MTGVRTPVTPPSVVVCFDRDDAVSVNPHPDPDKRMVPLAWVKYLAHEDPEVDVWATGNQALRGEAAIPGIDRAIEIWQSLDLEMDGRYSTPDLTRYEVPRRDRLHLVEDLYGTTDADIEFVVVDDVDLSNMAKYGWQHYFPWDFVDAVEEGTAPVSIPDGHEFTDEPFDGEVVTVAQFDLLQGESATDD